MVDIMFLARRDNTIRLISYRMNPYLFEQDINGIKDKGIFIPQESKFIIFSGFVRWPDVSDNKSLGMRIADDKIQACELLVESRVMHNSFGLIIQASDCIYSTWIVDDDSKVGDFKVISEPKEMNNLLLVRGNNDRVFFAETIGKNERIV